jgi:hypothetical protein
MACHGPTTRLSDQKARLYHFSWALAGLRLLWKGSEQKKAGAEAPAKKRRNLDSDAPSNLEDSRRTGEKPFNFKRMPVFPQAVNDRLQDTSNSYAHRL